MGSPQSALRDTVLRITGVMTGLLLQNDGFEMLDGLIFQCELLYRYINVLNLFCHIVVATAENACCVQCLLCRSINACCVECCHNLHVTRYKNLITRKLVM